MTPFFDTHYVIRRSPEAVFDFLSDFNRYHSELPEFRGSTLSSDSSPPGEGKVYWIGTQNDAYEFRTRVEVLEHQPPERFVYEYSYHPRDDDRALSAKAGPMPWNRARMILTFEPCKGGTRVRARMQVYGVEGWLSRWRAFNLKTACARAQRSANANMVRLAEQQIPAQPQ